MNIESVAEHFKRTQLNPKSPEIKAPVMLKFACRAEKDTLSPSQLSKLQIAVEPKLSSDKKVNPTFEVFELLGTSSAQVVADEFEYLVKNGSAEVREWLSTIDLTLENMIRAGTCPAIITSPLMIHCGNIPDGNHRTIAALRLSRQEEVTLPAYRLQYSTYYWALYNMLIFCDRMKSNPKGTIKIVNQRMKQL